MMLGLPGLCMQICMLLHLIHRLLGGSQCIVGLAKVHSSVPLYASTAAVRPPLVVVGGAVAPGTFGTALIFVRSTVTLLALLLET
jgi:hypothetical protein